MKKSLLLLAAALLMMSSAAMAQEEGKVGICHFPPGNPDNVRLITVDDSAAPKHIERHGDFVFEPGIDVNGVGCSFCLDSVAVDNGECAAFCLGPPACLCPEGDPECCAANPCCANCPDPKPRECFVISCGCEPEDCCLTVCRD